MRVKIFWQQLRFPLVMLVLAILLSIAWDLLSLPSSDALITVAGQYFGTYSYWAVFVSAMLEGFLLLGMYYPGSTVILFGVILAGDNLAQVALVVVITTAGLLIVHTLNYFLGRHGWYHVLAGLGLRGTIEKAKTRLTRYGPKAIFFSNWHPNMGAITSTAAGILGFPFRRFFLYTLASVAAWDVFWGILAYFVGGAAYRSLGPFFVFIVIGVWIVVRIVKAARMKPESQG